MKIFITGANNGIGFDAARELALRGHEVWAAARTPEDVLYLERYGANIVALDISNPDEREAIAAQIGAVDVLINSAGYGNYAPTGDVRGHFDATVYSMTELSKLMLPAMLMEGRGRIINVSGLSSRGAAESDLWLKTARYAVEAISEGMRTEYEPMGIDVVFIEPGEVKTNWGSVAAGPSPSIVVEALLETRTMGQNYLTKQLLKPSIALTELCESVEAHKKKPRYLVGSGAMAMLAMQTALSWRVVDVLLRMT